MISRENLITAVFVCVALPAAYLARMLLGSVGVGEQVAFGIAFAVMLVVGVSLPQQFIARFL